MWSFNMEDPAAGAELVLDLRDHQRPMDNLLAFAFHPGFATNRYVFVNYNEPGGRADGARVSRFTFSSLEPPRIDPESEVVILSWLSGGHNGCTLAFGNDGFLYISTGDAASPDPPDWPHRTGQDLGDLLSSILRIDVDRPEGERRYAIPPDNPFVNTPGARPEIWAFGLRNPWRMSFDRATGDLWVGDVGWEQWEMIYRVRRGGNYGWALAEGPNPHVRRDVAAGPGAILAPMVALPHSEAASITGGVVYRGGRLPGLRGAYVYGDWETGKFWALRHERDRLVSNEELCDTALKPVSFALDPEGEMLLLDYNGGIYRFIPSMAPPANEGFPRRLSETGLFDSLEPIAPARGTVSYGISAPMWNDHATAEWLLGVPGDGSIVTQGGAGNIAGSTWFFPSNTVLARTLTLEMESGNADSRRRVETQLLHWDGQGWNPYTYRWRKEQDDADLVPATGTNAVLTVVDAAAPGGRRETPWRFHGRAECLRCHNVWAGEALTLNWLQLRGGTGGGTGSGAAPSPAGEGRNRPATVVSGLEQLTRAGVLRVVNPPGRTEVLVDPMDSSRGLAERARSWLHVNCATCHRFGAGGSVAAQFNLEQPVEASRAYDAKPLRGDFGIESARVIAPGEPWRSVLLWRISTEGWGHMPLIGSRLVDLRGVQLIREWLEALKPMRPGSRQSAMVETSDSWKTSLGDSSRALAAACEAAAGARELREEVAVAAGQSTNAFVRDLFQRFLPPDQRRRILGMNLDPQEILGLGGDAARGRDVFLGAAQCTRCHIAEGQGRAFGPELAGLKGKYGRGELLDQILYPSRIVAPEFRTFTATLVDGSERIGFVVRRDEGGIDLLDETLTEHRVEVSALRELRESALSAMPEALLAPLTAQEAADLLEYLLSR